MFGVVGGRQGISPGYFPATELTNIVSTSSRVSIFREPVISLSSPPSIPAEYTKPDFLSPSILKVTVLPLADFFVQLSIISSLPERSPVSSRVCHLTREEFGAVLSVP